ncbi:5468_t:CDS:1, partial [Dentiscutata erythropus]
MPNNTSIQIHIDMSTLNVLPVDPTPCPYYDEQQFVTKADAAYQATLLALDKGERIKSL